MMQVANGLDDGQPQSVALLPHIAGAETSEQHILVKRLAISRHIADSKASIIHDDLHFAAGSRMAYGLCKHLHKTEFTVISCITNFGYSLSVLKSPSSPK